MGKPNAEIKIEESKKIQLELLSKIHSFCEEQNLTYFLMWGTLLGAVRHKGFIPWDDDIDIIMLRKDYESFCKNFQAEHAKVVEVYNQPDYYLPIGKVIDTRTVLRENVKTGCDIGVYVDIFVMDYLSRNETVNQKAIHKLLLLRNVLMLNIVPDSNKRTGYRKILFKMASPLTHIINMNHISQKMDSIAKNINQNAKEAEYVAALLTPDGNATKNLRFKKDLFMEKILLPFEDKFFWVPKKYDVILKKRYGNYMQYPPQEQQISHHEYKQYWK